MKGQFGASHGSASLSLFSLSYIIPSAKCLQAHPKYGAILASSSYDGSVKIWRESPPSQGASHWTIVASFSLHTASVNIVSWSPHESGCLLACASSDGQVSVLEFQEGNWTHQIFQAHGAGVNAVSWAPATVPGSLVSSKPVGGGVRRFVTGGSDNAVKIWDYKYVDSLVFYLELWGNADIGPIQPNRTQLHSYRRIKRPHRLGPGCCLGSHHSPKILYCLRVARQNRTNMDHGPLTT